MFGAILNQVYLGNSILNYIVCLIILLTGFLTIKIFKRIVLKNLKKWAGRTRNTLDDFVVSTFDEVVVPFLYFGAFYLSVHTLILIDFLNRGINVLAIGAMTVLTANLSIRLIYYGFQSYHRKTKGGAALEHNLKGIVKILKFVIWSLALIFLLDNLGFKISTVIAGLGIGGVAIALAAQAVLKDLFSYFSILFDRPFEVGDFIIVGDLLGTIEHIGIKTTRIRSLGGEQLVFSNSDLTDSRVRNYKRMEKRRVLFSIGVVYQTKIDQLKEIPKIIENIVKNIDDTVFDRAHFLSYGDFSLIFEIVYYVAGGDYNKYMNVQQKINFSIKEEFEKRGIEFAYPTQSIYLSK